MTQPPPKTRRSRGSTAKGLLIGLIIGAICTLAAYFIGQNNGKAGMAALQTQVTQAKADATRLEATNHLLQTRALIQAAANDLERRNFGTAGTTVQSAAKMLETMPAGAAVDTERVAAIRKQLEEVNINVSDDIGAQRTRLLDLAAQMDTLLPAPTPTSPAVPGAETAPEPGP